MAGANGCSRAVAVSVAIPVPVAAAAGCSAPTATPAASTLGESRRDQEHTDCQGKYESAKHHRCSASFRAQCKPPPVDRASTMPLFVELQTTMTIGFGDQRRRQPKCQLPGHFRQLV